MTVNEFLRKPIVKLDGMTITVMTVIIIIAAFYLYRRMKRG